MGGNGSKPVVVDEKPRRIDFRRLFPGKGHATVTIRDQQTKKEKATKVRPPFFEPACFVSGMFRQLERSMKLSPSSLQLATAQRVKLALFRLSSVILKSYTGGPCSSLTLYTLTYTVLD